MGSVICRDSRLLFTLFSLKLYIIFVEDLVALYPKKKKKEDLVAIGVTELSSFFYDSEVNRLFYMIPMLVFVFSGFLFCYIYLLHGDLRTCLWKLLNLFGWVGSWFQNSLCQNWPMLSHVREVLDKIVFSCLFWTVYVLFSSDFTFCSYLWLWNNSKINGCEPENGLGLNDYNVLCVWVYPLFILCKFNICLRNV